MALWPAEFLRCFVVARGMARGWPAECAEDSSMARTWAPPHPPPSHIPLTPPRTAAHPFISTFAPTRIQPWTTLMPLRHRDCYQPQRRPTPTKPSVRVGRTIWRQSSFVFFVQAKTGLCSHTGIDFVYVCACIRALELCDVLVLPAPREILCTFRGPC